MLDSVLKTNLSPEAQATLIGLANARGHGSQTAKYQSNLQMFQAAPQQQQGAQGYAGYQPQNQFLPQNNQYGGTGYPQNQYQTPQNQYAGGATGYQAYTQPQQFGQAMGGPPNNDMDVKSYPYLFILLKRLGKKKGQKKLKKKQKNKKI